MRRVFPIALGALLLVVAGLAAYGRASGVALPGVSPPPLAEALDRVAHAGDSSAVASFAHTRCRLLSRKAKQHCYEAIFLALSERGQVRLAMEALSRLGALDRSIPRNGHDYTHIVGINAWVPGKDLGAVYEACTGLYQSGCYHGVIQAYLTALGTDSSTVVELCDQIPSTRTNLWLRFQCVHGLGHGLVQAQAMHLPRSLSGCDLLLDSWGRESCYGGAFMEFVVGGRGQSHHPQNRANPGVASTEVAGTHQHHEAEAVEPPFKVRDRSDPLYPCSVLQPRYRASCYGMQAGIIIETTGPDFGKVARACDAAPAGWRETCYQGIGTYVSGITLRNTPAAIRLCSLGNPRYQPWCFVGVVKNYIDVTSKPEDGLAFCRELTDPVLATSCYVAVGQELTVLFSNMPAREPSCAKALRDYVEACRYGALLTTRRPPNLPSAESSG